MHGSWFPELSWFRFTMGTIHFKDLVSRRDETDGVLSFSVYFDKNLLSKSTEMVKKHQKGCRRFVQ